MTSDDIDIREPFKAFAGRNGDYYADTFLKIQKETLPRHHINPAALVGSFVWAHFCILGEKWVCIGFRGQICSFA